MDKKVVIGIAMILLLVGVIIVVYGGAQLVSPEEKVDANKEILNDGYYHYDSSLVMEVARNLGKKKTYELPTLPEGGNEVILGIIFIAGGIMLYVKKDKIIK